MPFCCERFILRKFQPNNIIIIIMYSINTYVRKNKYLFICNVGIFYYLCIYLFILHYIYYPYMVDTLKGHCTFLYYKLIEEILKMNKK